MFRQPLLALIAVAASLIDPIAYAQSPAQVLVRHATIVDGEHARLIAEDAAKRFLIPGLWDMHVHFGGGVDLIEENKALLPLYVAHGITTIRDASGDLPEQVLGWRREIASGA